MTGNRRGRRPDSEELKAAKVRLRAAGSRDARSAAEAEVEEIKVRERAARVAAQAVPTRSPEELFLLLVECDPRIREAEAAKREAAERVKEEQALLARAFGSVSVARKRLEAFRRARTEDSEAGCRARVPA